MENNEKIANANPVDVSSEQLKNLCERAISLINHARNTTVREINQV